MARLQTVTAEDFGQFICDAEDLTQTAIDIAERMAKGACDPMAPGWEQTHDLTRAIRALADLQSKLILRQRVDGQDAELAALRAQVKS